MFKRQVENRLNTLQQILPDTNGQSAFELEFVSNFQVGDVFPSEHLLRHIHIFFAFFQGYANRCEKYIWLRSIITRNVISSKNTFEKQSLSHRSSRRIITNLDHKNYFMKISTKSLVHHR